MPEGEDESAYIEKVKELETSDHGILFYRTHSHKQQVLFNFLNAGLNRDEGAVYIAGDEPLKRIHKRMLNYGFDVQSLGKEGRLKIVNYDGWYVVDGKVEISNIVALWKKAYEEALEMGLKGLCVCGETGCFFRHNLIEELVEYEKTLGRRLKIPMTALCAYQLQRAKFLEANFFLDLVKSHSHVFSSNYFGLFDFESFYQLVLPKELEATVGGTGAEMLLSFLKKWKPILEAELDDEISDLHTALKSFIDSRADQVEKRVQLRLYKKLGV